MFNFESIKPQYDVLAWMSEYYVTWEIIRNLNPEFGVKVPSTIISAYERATKADTSLIWK